MHSLSEAENTFLGNNFTSLNSRGNVHGSGTSPSLHQTVTWSLSSPFYNDTIHLTGVYIFPNEGNLEEFFDTLTVHSNHPCHEPHIYTGDFNACTAEEIESHVTPLDSHTLFHRMGDTNPAHSPAFPLTTDTASAADFRGRLLPNMLCSIEFIITNGRFPSPSPNHRPYTFFQIPNTYSILDYNLIAKRHAPLIRMCQVLLNVLSSSVTDHMPIHLHLDLPTSSNLVPPLPPHTSPARTLYHSKRLKDPQTKNAFTSTLAKKVAKITPTFSRLTAQLHSSKICPQSFADTANAAISEFFNTRHMWSWKSRPSLKMNLTNPLTNITLTTIPPKIPKKLNSNVQSSIIGTHSTPSKKTCLSMMPTHLPSTVTNSKRYKMPSTSYAQLKNKINYSPPSHKMQPTTWDPRTTNTILCGTTLRNTKITTLLLHYPRRHVLTNPQTNKSGRKDLLPSTPLTGTTFGLPSATTFFNTHSHPTTRKVHKTLLNSFPE